MDKVSVGVLVFLVLWIVGGITIFSHENNEKDFACQELGFVDYKNQNSMEYCEDIEGNLHYVKMDCKPWYWVKCTAKLISVGDVRVR